MATNLDRYKKDLARLIEEAEQLSYSFRRAVLGRKEFERQVAALFDGDDAKTKAFLKKVPDLSRAYQAWYSEAQALIRQLMPDRLNDFVGHYQKPKGRKDLTFESYRIEDALQGLQAKRGLDIVVDASAAIPHFEQQRAIVQAIERRFESSLFDIKQLAQADIFDSELESAGALLKAKFVRAAGAVAGVVLEKHLAQVCENHGIRLQKKNPTIADFNDALKQGDVVDTPQWRFIQHLGDLRNLCDHNKGAEPTEEQGRDLVDGVQKLTKTLF